MPRPAPTEFPISFALLEAAAFESVRKVGLFSTTQLGAIAKEGAFLGLSHRCLARKLTPRYDVAYVQAVLKAAELPPLPEQRSGRPMKEWYFATATVLHHLAEQPASIHRMGQAIQTYYTNILIRSTITDEGLLLPIGHNLTEEKPMDFVGLAAKSIWHMSYQRIDQRPGQSTFVPLWRPAAKEPSEASPAGSTIASEIIWHLPGHNPERIRQAIGSFLLSQATILNHTSGVTPATLFDQAQFNHALQTNGWADDAF